MAMRDLIRHAAAEVVRWASPTEPEEASDGFVSIPLMAALHDGRCGLVVGVGETREPVWVSGIQHDTDDQALEHFLAVLHSTLGYSLTMVESTVSNPDPIEAIRRRIEEARAVEVSAPEPDPDVEDDDDGIHLGGVWMAAWAEDIASGQVVRLPLREGKWGEGRVYEVRKGLLMAPPNDDPNVHFMGGYDPDVCILWTCSDDCYGHHWEGRPRAPVYIRQDAPDHLDDLG